MRWRIITGEYPPKLGGVADYTRQTACGLAAAGDEVEVWTGPLAPGETARPADAGITVRRLADHFGPRGLAELGAAFDQGGGESWRVLVQYEGWSYGRNGLNVPFCWWLWRRGRRQDFTVMFHEVATDMGWRLRLRQNVLGTVTRLMAALAARSARRAFISIPAWETILRPLVGRESRIAWLPVPSNIPTHVEAGRVAAVRAELLARLGLPAGARLVGHFGTFRGQVAELLGGLLPEVLEREGAGAVLIGRGGAEWAKDFGAAHPALAARVWAGGALESAAVAEYLAACDVLAQPYPDGVSARRSSTMAGMALGLPIVTNTGWLSEPLWEPSRAVRLAPEPSAPALAGAVRALLADAPGRKRLGETAAAYYREHFSVERVIAAVRDE